ncbi:MAG TPA: hypothetical protein VEV85_10055 [Bryobacteraceae bacterium]|nr:hypothetical protein [Bryobacteraceae bacterium]
MIEVIVTAAMLFGSVFLFAYWFRYTCLLILSTKTARDYAGALAEAYQLSFVDVQSRLRNCATANLERLHQSLDHDFAVVRRLLEDASSAQGQTALEMRMLQMNYRLMGGSARLCQLSLALPLAGRWRKCLKWWLTSPTRWAKIATASATA